MPRKKSPLWRIVVVVSAESEDAVSLLLSEIYGQPASSYTRADSGKVSVSVYVDRRRAFSPRRLALWQVGLARLRAAGFTRPVRHWARAQVKAEDWAESWKKHFQPFQIGGRLLIRPSWSSLRPKTRQQEVVLDPGLSFGTGQHPTTRFCLQQLVRARPRREAKSCLDLGTGSGILAIAASKLGYDPIEATDFDPAAVRIAQRNARCNHAQTAIRFVQQDLARRPRPRRPQHDVICANLMADLLISQRRRIVAELRPGGVLIVAGILRREFADVKRAFTGMRGIKWESEKAAGEWQSGVFRRVSLRS